jgi:tetratricopeptide (TPR) repeat protein
MDRTKITLSFSVLLAGVTLLPTVAQAQTPALSSAVVLPTLVGFQEADTSDLMRKANDARAAKQYAEAIKSYSQVIKLRADYSNAYLYRGICYYAQESPNNSNYDLAIADFTQFVTQKPKIANGWFNRAICYQAKKDYTKAAADFTEVINLNPPYNPAKDPQNMLLAAQNGRAACYIEAKEWQKAFDSASDYLKTEKIGVGARNAYVNRAIAATELKKTDAALADYSEAIALSSKDGSLYVSRAGLYFDQKQYKEAVADYTSAIQNGVTDVAVYMDRALAQFNVKSYTEAASDYGTVLTKKVTPEQAAATLKNRAACYIQTKEYDKAIGDYTEFIKRNPTTTDASVFQLRAGAYQRLATPNYAGASEDLTRYLALKPTDASALRDRAICYFNLGKSPVAPATLEKSLADCDAVTRLDASQADVSFLKAETLSLLGKFDAAVPAYQKYLAAPGKASDGDANYGLAVALYNTKKKADAAPYLEKFLAGNPKDADKKEASRLLALCKVETGAGALDIDTVRKLNEPDVWERYADKMLKEKKFDLAIEGFGAVIGLQADERAYNNRAVAYTTKAATTKKMEDYAAAAADYSEVIKRNPKNAKAFTARAQANLEQKKYTEAIADYSEYLKLEPSGAEAPLAYNNRAYCYTNLPTPDYKSIIGDYSALIIRTPTEPMNYYYRALAYNAQKEYPTAIADFDKFLMLKAGDTNGLVNRALALYNQGWALAKTKTGTKGLPELEKAMADYTQLLASKPNDALYLFSRGMCAFRHSEAQDKLVSKTADLKKASADFEAAVAAKASDTDAQYYAGLCYDNWAVAITADDPDFEPTVKKAIAAYEKFVALPGATDIEATKKRIADLKEALG